MSKLHEWVRSAQESDLLPIPGEDTGPAVKVAVLGSGAKFTEIVLRDRYDYRLREIRSWYGSSALVPDSGILMQDGEDDDGHGTFLTSLLLNTTQETDCLIYVAKVLGNLTNRLSYIAGGIAKV